MNVTARYQIPLVVIAIALLLLGPVGICAVADGANSSTHRCCQKPDVPVQHTSTLRGCCGDRKPIAISLTAFMAQGPVSEAYGLTAPVSPNAVDHGLHRAGSNVFTLNQKFLLFHQLLV
jgi:hypothetical protein